MRTIALALLAAAILAGCKSFPGADGRYADSDNGFRAILPDRPAPPTM